MPNTNLQPTIENVASRFRLGTFDGVIAAPAGAKRGLKDQVRCVTLKTFDAVITAPLRPRRRLTEQVRVIFSPKSRTFYKVCSVIDLMNQILPCASRGSLQFLTRLRQFPFENAHIHLIGCGSGATVFLLKTKHGPKALKIYRRSLGRRFQDLLEIVTAFKRKYERVSAWYNECFDLVPAATFLILKGPLLGVPVAAALQSYVDGEKKDLFREFSDEQLLSLMREQEDLRRQFVFFADRTLTVHSQERLSIDFLGRNNVVLANSGRRLRLALLDNGIFDLDAIRRRSPGVYLQIEKHVSRIKSLLKAAVSLAAYKLYILCILYSDLFSVLDGLADLVM